MNPTKNKSKFNFKSGMLVKYIGKRSSNYFWILGSGEYTNDKNYHKIQPGQVGLFIKHHFDTCEEVLFDDVIITLGTCYLELV